MPHWILAPMTASLCYRTLLILAIISSGLGIAASLTWVYVLYSREMADRDLKVMAILISMLVLTGASLLMARFAQKRIRTLPKST